MSPGRRAALLSLALIVAAGVGAAAHPAGSYRAIAAGRQMSCAIDLDDRLACARFTIHHVLPDHGDG